MKRLAFSPGGKRHEEKEKLHPNTFVLSSELIKFEEMRTQFATPKLKNSTYKNVSHLSNIL